MTTIPLNDSIVSATNNPQMAIEILGQLMGLDGAREVMPAVWKISSLQARLWMSKAMVRVARE